MKFILACAVYGLLISIAFAVIVYPKPYYEISFIQGVVATSLCILADEIYKWINEK